MLFLINNYAGVNLMAKERPRWTKFKKFLKRNMTPTWAKHFSYQVVSFIISVLMVVGVANYAVTESYDGRRLRFMDDFTITAHTGSFDTEDNSIESVQAAINNNVKVFEIDIRQRPDGTLVMNHDLVVTNNDGIPLEEALEMLKNTQITLNLDIKETRTLNALHDMLVEYEMLDRAFLTGIETLNVKALKESSCADMNYYLNYQPSRIKVFSDDYRAKILNLLAETGAIGINCNYKYAGGQLSDLLHENGYKLSVWTVNKQNTMKRVLMLKPDNITTKEYDLLASVIDNWGK